MNNKCFSNFYFWQNSGFFYGYEFVFVAKI